MLLLLLQVYAEGTHLMVPWFERPMIYDVRARPSLIQSQSGSRDLQMVSNCCQSDYIDIDEVFTSCRDLQMVKWCS